MLFNSYIFILLFLPLVILGYYGLNYMKKYKLALGYLTGMSMWFCAYMNISYLWVLIISTLINYGLVKVIIYNKSGVIKKVLLLIGLVFNIGSLFYFKYYNFFIGNINDIFGANIPLIKMMLPLGVSFYTFQNISYLVDGYRGQTKEYSLLEYIAYATFFPKFIQGPISYHDEIILQLRKEENRRFNYDNLSNGIYSFALGLAKKVLIADTFSKIVGIGYGNVNELNATSAVLTMIAYSLQIYFDFSGYCDMANGIGYIFNIELPINFNSPYKAKSVVDFWSRWHMTLTRFFTKYLYIPLGGNRKGLVRTYVNVLIVFLVSGLWHGANWTFIIWGAMHGIAEVIERLKPVKFVQSKVPGFIRVLITFVFVTLAWSLFRADSVEQVTGLWNCARYGEWGQIYAPMAEVFNSTVEMTIMYRLGFSGIINSYPGLPVIIFTLTVLLACFFMKNTNDKIQNMKFTNIKIFVIIVLIIWSVLSLSEVTEFLYVNF